MLLWPPFAVLGVSPGSSPGSSCSRNDCFHETSPSPFHETRDRLDTEPTCRCCLGVEPRLDSLPCTYESEFGLFLSDKRRKSEVGTSTLLLSEGRRHRGAWGFCRPCRYVAPRGLYSTEKDLGKHYVKPCRDRPTRRPNGQPSTDPRTSRT